MIRFWTLLGTGIIAMTVLFFYYIGMFDRLALTREPRGPYTLVYRDYQGSYKGVRYVMNNVYRYVRDTLHLQAGTGFAVFYDNPQAEPAENLRSICGIVVTDSVTPAHPYKTGVFERTDAVVGMVKLRGFFSYAIGGYRFYSRLERFASNKNIEQTGPALEIYDMKKRSILYIAPVGRTISPAPEFDGR